MATGSCKDGCKFVGFGVVIWAAVMDEQFERNSGLEKNDKLYNSTCNLRMKKGKLCYPLEQEQVRLMPGGKGRLLKEWACYVSPLDHVFSVAILEFVVGALITFPSHRLPQKEKCSRIGYYWFASRADFHICVSFRPKAERSILRNHFFHSDLTNHHGHRIEAGGMESVRIC